MILSLKKHLRRIIGSNATRGFGLCEYLLAIRRAQVANKHISSVDRNGSIVDIGCGDYPIFLLTSKFVEKYAVEQKESDRNDVKRRISYVPYDGDKLPFQDGSVSVVSLLAVAEHLPHEVMLKLFDEISRILIPNGKVIITVPSFLGERILRVLAVLGIVSKTEIEEHKNEVATKEMIRILYEKSFTKVKTGKFEFFMNRWFVGFKQDV